MLPALGRPVLRCSSKFTVFSLRKFVVKKLEAAGAGALAPDQIEILCAGEVLGGEHNLRFIRKTRWFDATQDMQLGYRQK